MSRHKIWLLALLAAVFMTAGGTARADRLGGAYRGPSDTGAQDKSESNESEDSGGDDIDSGPSAGDSGDSDSGFGGSEGGGSEGGGSEGGGESGAPEGGGGDEGGDDGGFSGGGDESEGASAGGSDTGGSSAPSSSTGAGRGKGGSNAQEAFQRVLWFFEHNREQYVFQVAEARNNKLVAPAYSAVGRMSILARDERERSSVTTEDRERIFDILKKQARADKSIVRDAAVIALGKLGTPEAVEVLKDALEAESQVDVKQDTLLALGLTQSPDAVDAILPYLGKRRFQSFALLGLGLSGNAEKAAPAVLAFLDANARKGKLTDQLCSATMALGSLRDANAIPTLSKLMAKGKADKLVQVYAAHALGKIGGDEGRKELLTALKKTKDIDVQRAVILALGHCGDAKVLKDLAGKNGMGKSSDLLAAGFACISTASILQRTPESEWKKYPEQLRELAMSPQKGNIRAQYANLALAMCNAFDQETRAYYSEQLEKQKLQRDTMSSLAMACGLSGLKSYEPAMAKMAASASLYSKTRGYAALAVGMLGNSTEASAKLREIYEDGDDPDVRRGAMLGLGLVGDRYDVEFLIDVIKDKDDGLHTYTRGAAVVALGLIRDGESIKKIQKLLSSNDARTRGFAVAALGYLVDKNGTPAMPQLFASNNFRQEFPTLKTVMANL